MATTFPTGWAAMEIEAKWDTDQPTFDSIVAAFPDGGSRYGYGLEVRWSGVPRRYSDVYYDDPGSTLFGARHSLRHRQRHETGPAIDITQSFADLAAAPWFINWNKVQYKSDPTRLAAVWFRTEQGDARLDTAQVTNTLAGTAPTPPYTATDNPVTLLLDDHAGFDFSQLDGVLDVVQYRHRVKFFEGTQERYELSLDKVVSTPAGGTPTESFAVELEAARDGSHTESAIDRLLELMVLLEEDFDLVRATTSKGGLGVEDTAEPEMRLDSTTIDYGSVELGFSYRRAIVVHNDGYAPLNVTAAHQATGAPDEAWWTLQEHPTPVEVPPRSHLALPQVFTPAAVDASSIEFGVAGDDTANSAQTVTLLGEGKAPTPIDSVLVLDRSGSMDQAAGEPRKIDAMRDAADLYAHLLRPTPGGMADTIGLVKYNHTNSVYLPLDAVDDPSVAGSHMEELEQVKLSDAALSDVARLRPDGATGIGGAMNRAAGMFAVPAGDRRHVMVVLTDGKENRDPEILDVIEPIQDADPALAMYSVGVGDNIEPAKLQSITNAGDGYHQITGALSGLERFALEMFYFKIFASAADLDLAIDPTAEVPLHANEPIVVHRVRISSSDKTATFVVLDVPELRPLYELALRAPNGQVMGSGVVAGGVAVHYLARRNYTICKIVLPDAGADPSLVGDWEVVVTPKGRRSEPSAGDERVAHRSFGRFGLAPIGFAAAVGSDYRIRVKAVADPAAAVVRLTAVLTDQGWPVDGAEVLVDVVGPGGTVDHTVELTPGANGTSVGEFVPTDGRGSYRFVFRSRGRNTFGELVPREAARTVTIVPPGGAMPLKCRCLHCKPHWVAMVVLAILLPWIILLIAWLS